MADFRILIADDDEDDYFILKSAFDELIQHEISVVCDGQQLLDYLQLKKDLKLKFPDLILLDINMPRMDGIKALEILKSTELLKNIPVVMYTTSNDNDQKKMCEELGAQGFISKVSSHEELISFVQSMNVFLEELRTEPFKPFVHNKATIPTRK